MIIDTDFKRYLADGPWTIEPDDFEFSYKDYKCFGKRNAMGFWCGYVILPAGHSLIRDHYENIPLEVHGGLTYGKHHEDKSMTIGFDCAHLGDKKPSYNNQLVKEIILDPILCSIILEEREGTYKTIEFVQRECRKMVDQIVEFDKKDLPIRAVAFPKQPAYREKMIKKSQKYLEAISGIAEENLTGIPPKDEKQEGSE